MRECYLRTRLSGHSSGAVSPSTALLEQADKSCKRAAKTVDESRVDSARQC